MCEASISMERLQRNFAEVKPAMTPMEAAEESNRCLFCYDAPCVQACPTGIDVPSFIRKIATGNLRGSARVIMEANPVGATCARVCPTEELCEGACVLNRSSKPIRIGELQRYATDSAMRSGRTLFQAGPANGKRVAVIGGGPAGLSAARELARFGFAVTVFEAKELAGGLDTYGIVSFRLPQEVPLWEAEQVRQLGVDIRTGVRVGTDVPVTVLRERYDAIVLAAGMGKVPRLGIPGEELRGVYDAIEFVESTKTSDLARPDIAGRRVAVIGAGNTAIDAATCSVRLGAASVKIVYRRTAEEMTAYAFEFDFAKREGVGFEWLAAPVRIVGGPDGGVAALECVRMRLEEAADGRRRPVPVEGSAFRLEADAVIFAIGQTRHAALIEELGLAHRGGVVAVDPATTYRTSDPRVFAAGDVIFGAGQGEATVVSAARQGRDAAYAVYEQLIKRSSEPA